MMMVIKVMRPGLSAADNARRSLIGRLQDGVMMSTG
jgi:hypothetical protein